MGGAGVNAALVRAAAQECSLGGETPHPSPLPRGEEGSRASARTGYNRTRAKQEAVNAISIEPMTSESVI
jgi:hypothetical protein